MGNFLSVFGDMTVTELVIFIGAVGFLLENIKKLYKWATSRHDDIQEQQDMVNTVKELEVKLNILLDANLAVLSLHLHEECERALLQGEITINDLEKIKRLYEPYHALGGNGTGTKLFNDCLRLPIKK